MPRQGTGKRERILETARKLFSEKSYHMVTVEEIARKANVKKPTLYYYFGSKKELFLEVFNSCLEELGRVTMDAINARGTVMERIESFITAVMEFLEENKELLLVLVRERLDFLNLTDIQKRVGPVVSKGYWALLSKLTDVIEQGQKERVFREEINPLAAAMVLIDSIFGLALRWVYKDIPSLSKASSLVRELFLYGLLSREGER